jgi:hypothetical protein
MTVGHIGYCHVYDPNELPVTFGETTTSHTHDFREAQPPEDDFPYLSSLYVNGKERNPYQVIYLREPDPQMPNIAPNIDKIF